MLGRCALTRFHRDDHERMDGCVAWEPVDRPVDRVIVPKGEVQRKIVAKK